MEVRELCLICRHQTPLTGGCNAFPGNIPYKFTSGEKEHLKVEKEQVGTIVFEEGQSDEIKALNLKI